MKSHEDFDSIEFRMRPDIKTFDDNAEWIARTLQTTNTQPKQTESPDGWFRQHTFIDPDGLGWVGIRQYQTGIGYVMWNHRVDAESTNPEDLEYLGYNPPTIQMVLKMGGEIEWKHRWDTPEQMEDVVRDSILDKYFRFRRHVESPAAKP